MNKSEFSIAVSPTLVGTPHHAYAICPCGFSDPPCETDNGITCPGCEEPYPNPEAFQALAEVCENCGHSTVVHTWDLPLCGDETCTNDDCWCHIKRHAPPQLTVKLDVPIVATLGGYHGVPEQMTPTRAPRMHTVPWIADDTDFSVPSGETPGPAVDDSQYWDETDNMLCDLHDTLYGNCECTDVPCLSCGGTRPRYTECDCDADQDYEEEEPDLDHQDWLDARREFLKD